MSFVLSSVSPDQFRSGMFDQQNPPPVQKEIDKKLEKLLWSEMLKHTGLEASFTLGGGEGAVSFARYMVEEIAENISEAHPLEIGKKVQ